MPTPKISISAEVQTRWDEFAAANNLSAAVLAQAQQLQSLWQQSTFCARVCTQYPDIVDELLQLSCADNAGSVINLKEILHSRIGEAVDEDQFKQILRHFRNTELVKICWQDLILQVDAFHILRELSALGDVCVCVAADWLCHRLIEKHGEPLTTEGDAANLVVIALGKLGGKELNFSSDIDVMFCYSANGKTNGQRSMDNQQFFISLAQKLIHSLADVTADGFVYRVDCRLRPFGESGPLVVNFNHLEDYYQAHGREWERYAFIKARVVYGSDRDRELFKELVTPFVYRKYIDFGVIDTLREMKHMIAEQVAKARYQNNIKLGAGGIREIEFIAQFFQLVNGGRNTRLQTQHIEDALTEIEHAGYLTRADVRALTQSYIFLRCVENRLQMRSDEQTHVLPVDQEVILTLAQSMNYAGVDDFMRVLQLCLNRVSNIFAQISEAEASPDQGDDIYTQYWDLMVVANEDDAQINFASSEFKDFEHIHNKLVELKKSPGYKSQDSVGRERLHVFMPIFLRRLQQLESPALVIDRLLLLITKILRRSAYLVLLSENTTALDQLVEVVSSSPWIATHLTAYPLLLDELVASSRSDYEFSKQEIEKQFHDEVLQQSQSDYEHTLEHVRMFKHARELRVACADVQDRLSIMKVSDQLSWTAEAIVSGCLTYLENTFDESVADDMAVIAFGKLGGIELSYGSDLDLVYIAQNERDANYSAQEKVPYIVKISKHAQRLTQMLTLQTVSGKLYDVDTRLRPDGESGPIVAQFDFLQQYYESRAWLWEIQALVRARCIAGSADVCQRFYELRSSMICQQRDAHKLAQQVLEMRSKMLVTKGSKSGDIFDLKNDEGGITDIEFMVQYAVLAHAYKDTTLCEYSDNVRLLERLAGGGFVSESIAKDLTDIYCRYRNRTHRLALQAQTTKIALSEYEPERKVVRQYWEQLLEVSTH